MIEGQTTTPSTPFANTFGLRFKFNTKIRNNFEYIKYFVKKINLFLEGKRNHHVELIVYY